MAFNTKNATTTTKPAPLAYGINENGMILLPYFNLDNDKKSALGLRTFKDEPEYVREKEDKETGEKYKTLVCEFYVKVDNKKLIGTELSELNSKVYPITFFIDNVERPAGRASGKMQFVNTEGQSAWLFGEDDEENMKWWKDKDGNINKKGLRRAFKGEADFMEALTKMSGLSRGGYETFNWKKLFAGDFSEVRSSLKEMIQYHKELSDTNDKLSEPRSSMLFYISESEVETEDGKTIIYYNQRIWNKQFSPNKIRKELTRLEESGYELKGIYKNEQNVVTGYLNTFVKPNDFAPPTDTTSGDDLPF